MKLKMFGYWNLFLKLFDLRRKITIVIIKMNEAILLKINDYRINNILLHHLFIGKNFFYSLDDILIIFNKYSKHVISCENHHQTLIIYTSISYVAIKRVFLEFFSNFMYRGKDTWPLFVSQRKFV